MCSTWFFFAQVIHQQMSTNTIDFIALYHSNSMKYSLNYLNTGKMIWLKWLHNFFFFAHIITLNSLTNLSILKNHWIKTKSNKNSTHLLQSLKHQSWKTHWSQLQRFGQCIKSYLFISINIHIRFDSSHSHDVDANWCTVHCFQ